MFTILKRRVTGLMFLLAMLGVTAWGVENLPATRYNSTEEKLAAIDEQIKEFEMKKAGLEKLKETYLKRDVDFKNPNLMGARPKIGLVLSGGGAKGAAHIGVLKVMEKYQIPVDYIVGTSAGSIIAAMYSIGYTPDEIEKTVNSLNFGQLFTNSTARNLTGILEKSTDNQYPLTLSIDKDMNLSLPMGVLDGEQIYLQLKDIFGRAEGIEEFKDLPIPFRAMTTDLQTGHSVAENSGDLALATLKSMAIPTFLDPIRDGDRYYVDGGVADNFPVLQAVNMGADIVIGIDISSDSIKITDNSNIITILDKLSTYNGDMNTKRQKKFPDLLITPDVKDHSTLDFNDLRGLVKEGEAAAEKLDFYLSKLSDREDFEKIKRKAAQLKSFEVDVKRVELTGNNILTVAEVEKLRPKSGILDRDELNLWAEKIYANKFIDRVFYHVEGDTIKFNVREKIDNKLKGGISYASNYGAALELEAEIPVLKKMGLSQKNYTVKTELSKYPKIELRDVTQFKLLDTNFVTSGILSYGLNPIFIYNNGDNISTYKSNELDLEISLAKPFGDNGILAYAIGFKDLEASYQSGLRLDKFTQFEKEGTYFTNALTYYYDNANSRFLATEGRRLFAQAFIGTKLNNGESYQGYQGLGEMFMPITKKLSFNLGLNGGQIFEAEKTPLSEVFSIGGLRGDGPRRNFMFYGVPMGGIYTDEFFGGSAGFQYSLFSSLYFVGRYNIVTYDHSPIYGDNKKIWNDKLVGYGAGFGWNTFLGPMDFVVSNDALGSGALFQVHIGYIF